jgi:hypothetical protein
MRASRPASLATLLVLFSLAGCSGDDKTTKPVVQSDGLPAGTPQADSPQHLATRLEATWESQVEGEYGKLLSDDFRFHFSLNSDPELVNQYGDNWKRADEIAAFTHLFHGFMNTGGMSIPGASRIDLTLTGSSYGNDFDHGDSTAQYRHLVVTNFDLQVEVPTVPEPVLYSISSRQELFLVRGDAAVLPAGAAADTTHWYIRRWEDLATVVAARKGPVINPAAAATLGRVKSTFYQ